MSPQPTDSAPSIELRSEAYHITVDGGRDSFCALSLECPENTDAWLISDTVHSVEAMR